MRILGYFILIAGFFLIHLEVYPRGGVVEARCIKQLNEIPDKDLGNRADVLLAMKKVALSTWDMAPWPTGGALIMATGAVLSDIGSRRERKRAQRSNAVMGSS